MTDPLTLHWFLPTNGDSRHITGGHVPSDPSIATGDRSASIGYLASIARAAEDFGFVGALTPTGAWCEDAWITTAMLARETERLAFLIALRPGLLSPTLAAQMAATFLRSAPGRLLLNVVVGGESHEQRSYGDSLDKDERYARCDEFLAIVRALWAGERVTHRGVHVTVEDAALPFVPAVAPPLYFGGSSAAAAPVAAHHADVYLTWGEPVDAVAEKIGAIRERAAQEGRTVRFGVRLHVISRDTSEAAWAEAARLLSAIGEDAVTTAQSALARSESVGQRRMLRLHERSRADGSWRDPHALEVAPGLWAGVGLVRGGAGTALVGSHAEVADAMAAYGAVGIDEFVLSGYPHLEELYWFGEGVLPHLRRRGLAADRVTGPGPVNQAFLPAAAS